MDEPRGPYVWEAELELQYHTLKQTLLIAAEDCEKRGHSKSVSERFRAAAEVCERAGQTP